MVEPLVTNAADLAQIAEGQREEKTAHEQQIEDLQAVLELRAGRRVLWRYLSHAGVFQSSYVGNAEGTIFNEGKRVMGTTIMADITAAKPEAFIQMMLEAKAEDEIAQRSAEARQKEAREQ